MSGKAILTSTVWILWADHIVFLYPLWLGHMPALLQAFLEHALRLGIAL